MSSSTDKLLYFFLSQRTDMAPTENSFIWQAQDIARSRAYDVPAARLQFPSFATFSLYFSYSQFWTYPCFSQVYDFTADDLTDLGEIGRGAFGTVNKMVHEKSHLEMAVKVRRSCVRNVLLDVAYVLFSQKFEQQTVLYKVS